MSIVVSDPAGLISFGAEPTISTEVDWLNWLDKLIDLLEQSVDVLDADQTETLLWENTQTVLQQIAEFLGLHTIKLVTRSQAILNCDGILMIPPQQHPSWPILFVQPLDQFGVGDGQLNKLAELANHFYFWLSQSQQLNGLRQEVDTLYQALETAPVALSIIDDQLDVFFLNQACRALLEREEGFVIKDRKLTSASFLGSSLFSSIYQFSVQSIVQFTRFELGDCVIELIKLNRDRSLASLNFENMQQSIRPFFNILVLIHTRYLVVDDQLKPIPEAIDHLLATKFGLTTKERRLAWNLGMGMSIQQYALLCQRSVETIRSQIKAVYRKLGVQQQKSLNVLMFELMTLESWRTLCSHTVFSRPY